MKKVGRPLLALALLAALSASLAQAEVAQQGNLRVSFEGKISPHALPRQGAAPISVSLGGQVLTTDGSAPPQLQRIQIELNRVGAIDYRGLPACRLEEIQPATTQNALRACGPAKVGEGSFAANVAIPEQSPFPSQGKLVAFNGTIPCSAARDARASGSQPPPHARTREGAQRPGAEDMRHLFKDLRSPDSQSQSDSSWGSGERPATRAQGAGRAEPCTRPVIFAHVYGTEPLPTSFTLALRISKEKGTYGTLLKGSLPSVAANIAFVTQISMKLSRSFHRGGKRLGYVSAGCPAPRGFPGAVFPLVRASFAFADGRTLSSVLNRSCRVRG